MEVQEMDNVDLVKYVISIIIVSWQLYYVYQDTR